jgi:hypothetical protein
LRMSEFLLVAASQVATAADTHRFSCALVRLYVAPRLGREAMVPLMSRLRLPATVSAQACSRPGS